MLKYCKKEGYTAAHPSFYTFGICFIRFGLLYHIPFKGGGGGGSDLDVDELTGMVVAAWEYYHLVLRCPAEELLVGTLGDTLDEDLKGLADVLAVVVQ
jgi:hypothetical protein